MTRHILGNSDFGLVESGVFCE